MAVYPACTKEVSSTILIHRAEVNPRNIAEEIEA